MASLPKPHRIRSLTGSSQQGNPRSTALLAVAKANDLKIELVKTQPQEGVSDDYRKLNKLGLIPTFEGQDGFVLSEAIAIAIYRKCISHCNGDRNKRPFVFPAAQ